MFGKKRTVDFSHELMKKFVKKNGVIIDAMLGTKKVTLYIYSIIKENEKIYAFDVQKRNCFGK